MNHYFLGIDIAKTNHIASLIGADGSIVIRTNELPRGKPSIVHRTIASLRERGIIPSVLTNAIFYEASLRELNPKRLNLRIVMKAIQNY